MKQNLLFNRASAICKRLAMVLTMLLVVGVGQAWGAEGDTHNFSQSLSQLLNNNASVASIEIAEQSYAIKTVKITSDYNKTAGGVTMEVFVGGISWGTATHNSNAEKTFTFNGTSTKGTVTIKFTNNCGSGTGKGTFKVSNVQLVEGASAPANPYTVTLKDDNSTLTQSTAGATITLPSRDGCDGYEFVGWTKSWSVAQTTWTTTAPTIIPDGSYTPTDNESLYPVYTKTEGGTPVPATLTASYTSYSGWTATNCGGSSYWVLKQNASITSPVISDLSTVTSITFKVRTYGGSSYKTVNVSTSGGTSIGSASASNTTLTLKTIDVSPKLSGSGSIVFSSTTTSSSNGPGINEITINYSTGGSTTYYISVPDCATQTAVYLIPKNSNFWMAHLRLIFGVSSAASVALP